MLDVIMVACACGTITILLGLVALVVLENRRSQLFDRAGQEFLFHRRLR